MKLYAQNCKHFITYDSYSIVGTQDLIIAGESLTTEFKSDYNDADLVRAVACLANGEGGTLLLGVKDDGTVVGAKLRHVNRTDPARVAALIQNSTEPPLGVDVNVEQIAGKEIVRIDVPRAEPGPVGTKKGTFTRRALDSTGKPECVPMTIHEIVSMGVLTRGQDFASAIARGATTNDLLPQEFDRFRKHALANGDSIGNLSDLDILKALGLAPTPNDVTLGAILLFGTSAAIERWVPNAEALFQDLRANATMMNERLVGPLFQTAEQMAHLIDQCNSKTELFVGMSRIEVDLIPEKTRREAIANALVHRDYSQLGPIQVQLSSTEFIVSSPGGLPPGITISNILDQSRPRSPLLAGAFKRAGFVDRKGKGVNEMFEQQIRAGRAEPDYSRTTSSSVTVAVPLGSADLDVVRFLTGWENEHQVSLNLDELRLVHEIKASGAATNTELSDQLGMRTSAVRANTTRLSELGIIDHVALAEPDATT